jgi:hypothetical protein
MSLITYGGYLCGSPGTTLETCRRLHLPADWWGLPNQWVGRTGARSGTGYVLMSREALDALGLNGQHSLVMSVRSGEIQGKGAGREWSVTHQRLHIASPPKNLTPGLRGDKAATYLVELADRRRLDAQRPVNVSYNVRKGPPNILEGYEDTLNAEEDWEWAELLEDLWGLVGTSRLGTFPGLPSFTPDEPPENLSFFAMSGLEAIEAALSRIGCTLILDTITDTYGIVRMGSSDATQAAALAAYDYLRCLDDEPLQPTIGSYPQKVRVYFPKQEEAAPTTVGDSPFYELDVTDPSPTQGYDDGSYHVIIDDFSACYDNAGDLINDTELAARALERATDYFRTLKTPSIRRTYTVPIDDYGFRPGQLTRATRWGDRGSGMVTEIIWRPEEAMPQFGGLPLPAASAAPRLSNPAGAVMPQNITNVLPLLYHYMGWAQSNAYLGTNAAQISAASGATPGSGTVTVWEKTASGYASTGITVTAYNPTPAVIHAGSWGQLFKDPYDGTYWFIVWPRLRFKEVDGAPLVDSVIEVQIDQTAPSGLVLTDLGNGVVKLAGTTGGGGFSGLISVVNEGGTDALSGWPVTTSWTGATLTLPYAGYWLVICDGWCVLDTDTVATDNYIEIWLQAAAVGGLPTPATSNTRRICAQDASSLTQESFCIHRLFYCTGTVTITLTASVSVTEGASLDNAQIEDSTMTAIEVNLD